MESKLHVENLTISFHTVDGKVQAVRGINFDLQKGETLAIVGESGSGKSVTSKAILGIQAANALTESGEIIYDGKDLLKISEEELAERMENFVPKKKELSGYLKRYAALVSSGAKGAILSV